MGKLDQLNLFAAASGFQGCSCNSLGFAVLSCAFVAQMIAHHQTLT
jgi:hypothetical protein